MPSPTTRSCPCGEETLNAVHGRGVLGAECASRVVRNLRWWLHRRYPSEHEDFVQEVYLKLVGKNGLESFVPPPDSGAEAFRGWLYGVVRFYALYTIQQRTRRDHIGLAKTEMLPEPISGDQAFARMSILEMISIAVEAIKLRWCAKGGPWAERFEVFLLFVREEDTNYARAQARLGISYELAKKLCHDLKSEICFAVRAQVRDTLSLEPGLDFETIERLIDQEIQALFAEAFSDDCVWDLFFPEPKPESQPGPEDPRSKP